MTRDMTRRSVAKGVAWSVPALAVAAAAPASAASCTPSTVTNATAVTWSSTQTNFTSDNGDPEYHTVLYTFTNTGSGTLPAGAEFDVHLTLTVLSGEEASVAVQEASSQVSATVTNSSTDDDDAGTTTDTAVVKVVTTAAVPVNGTFSVTVLATYGAMAADGVGEDVTVESPATSTDSSTCTTTVTTVTLSGASDGSSYTSPD